MTKLTVKDRVNGLMLLLRDETIHHAKQLSLPELVRARSLAYAIVRSLKDLNLIKTSPGRTNYSTTGSANNFVRWIGPAHIMPDLVDKVVAHYGVSANKTKPKKKKEEVIEIPEVVQEVLPTIKATPTVRRISEKVVFSSEQLLFVGSIKLAKGKSVNVFLNNIVKIINVTTAKFDRNEEGNLMSLLNDKGEVISEMSLPPFKVQIQSTADEVDVRVQIV